MSEVGPNFEFFQFRMDSLVKLCHIISISPSQRST